MIILYFTHPQSRMLKGLLSFLALLPIVFTARPKLCVQQKEEKTIFNNEKEGIRETTYELCKLKTITMEKSKLNVSEDPLCRFRTV